MMKNKKSLLALMLILCNLFMTVPIVSCAAASVTARVTAVDSNAKTITLTLSENIEGSIGELYIFDTEACTEIEAEGAVQDLNKIVVRHKDELAEVTEHAIVFVDDVYGTSGEALADKYVYFTTDASGGPEEAMVFDYDAKSTTASDQPAHWASADSGDEDHGKAMQITAYNTSGSMDNDLGNITYYSSDKWAVSFDVKIVKSPASFGILLFGETNSTPTSFGFTPVGRVMFRDNMWMDQGQLTADIDRWFGDSVICDYKEDNKVGEWVNYKVVYDKNANLFTVFVDGVQKITVTPSKPFNKLTKIRISMRNQNNTPTQDETLIWFDNLTVEKYPSTCKVEKIRMFDLNEKAVAAPQTTKRDIDRIDVTFMCEVYKPTVTKETVKLMYNGTDVSYEFVETYNNKTCTIKPSVIPENEDTVTLVISGVMDVDNTNVLADYTTSIVVKDSESGFISSPITLVSPDGSPASIETGGELYAKVNFANKSSVDKDVVIVLAGYDGENSLEAVGCKKLTVPANSLLTVDNIQNAVWCVLPYDGSIRTAMGSANMVENGTLIPLTEAYVIESGM
ncbi:MAG: hypothetical protein J6D26_00120 [Clostridia bacterium]|nr:hypothetical protein [Clostridia bacterium]